jgi:hypothetical protein
MRLFRIPMLALATILVAPAVAGAQVPAQVGSGCLDVSGVTAFEPRGELYVSVQARCAEDDFDYDDSLVAYLEVVLDETNTIGDDVRVYADDPRAKQTFQFTGLDLEPNQLVMVRLVRMGEIMSLQTIRVP